MDALMAVAGDFSPNLVRTKWDLNQETMATRRSRTEAWCSQRFEKDSYWIMSHCVDIETLVCQVSWMFLNKDDALEFALSWQ